MKTALTAAALMAAALVAGCDSPAPEAPAPGPDVEVSNARLMLPAVAGNPGAVYFDVANNGDGVQVIRAAAVEGAGSTTVHVTETTGMFEIQQVIVPAGETVKFEPGGRHVMAMDLDDSLAAGGETEVTVTLVGGDKVSFPAEVRAAGDAR